MGILNTIYGEIWVMDGLYGEKWVISESLSCNKSIRHWSYVGLIGSAGNATVKLMLTS